MRVLVLALLVVRLEAPDPLASEHVYDVAGRMRLPVHGVVESKMTVRLLAVDGEQLVRLEVDANSSIRGGRYGVSQTNPQSLDRFPFYFQRTTDGAIVQVLSHPDETTEAVGAKKALAAAHQLAIRAKLPIMRGGRSGTSNWTVDETDAAGHASARYQLRRALGRFRNRAIVRKRLAFRAGSDTVPHGFAYDVNTTAASRRVLIRDPCCPLVCSDLAFSASSHNIPP